MIGTGDFDRDGNQDILWQHPTLNSPGIWYLNADLSIKTVRLLPGIADTNWRMVGVADFDRDGWPDILFQYRNGTANAIWYMQGTWGDQIRLGTVNFPYVIDPNWRIVGVTHFERSDSVPVSNGIPDVIWRHYVTGNFATWYMRDDPNDPEGTQLGKTKEIGKPWYWTQNNQYILFVKRNLEEEVTGFGQFNGDGSMDVLIRHATVGWIGYWYIIDDQNHNDYFYSGSYAHNVGGRHQYNTEWRVASQKMEDSTFWMDDYLQTTRATDKNFLTASVDEASANIQLNYYGPSIFTARLLRRTSMLTDWDENAHTIGGVPRSVPGSYLDQNLQTNVVYEYKFYPVSSASPYNQTTAAATEHVVAGFGLAPRHDRGKVILVVDTDIKDDIATSLTNFKDDLVGDGWSWVQVDAARHNTDWEVNKVNIPDIRSDIVAKSSGASMIVIIGHVAVPYAGQTASDGHECPGCTASQCVVGIPPNTVLTYDHKGAWAADMYYADIDTEWTADIAVVPNCLSLLNDNQAGDKKFDNDTFLSPAMRIPIGRIDFARLQALGTTDAKTTAEINQLNAYFSKDRKYRNKQLSWQLQNYDQCVAYGSFSYGLVQNDFAYRNAIKNGRHLYGNLSGKLFGGDIFFQRHKSWLWGFLAGSGEFNSIDSPLYPTFRWTTDIPNSDNEPTTPFCTLTASWMGDWNTGSDNFLRTILACPNYGLASTWVVQGLWRLDAMALGAPLGNALARTVSAANAFERSPPAISYDRMREMAIQGDPTLRLHVLAPPKDVRWNATLGRIEWIEWDLNETGCMYFVYDETSTPAFKVPLATANPLPVDTTSYVPPGPPNSTGPKYMVRAVKKQVSGNGTYWNQSQGQFVTR